ncbi:MAG: Guanylate kinase [Alphaproteobacteria bacterium MarineAlpha9_Bin2]|nr:MAG: Guanylate kinase [Alphaproteobacteria bacterium MarineAlpha9_Bin2]
MDKNTNKGVMFVLSSPSGAGKTSICKSLLKLDKNISLSISVTTRPIRQEEEEGQDYFFVNNETFDNMLKEGSFIEHASVFGHNYGTLKKLVKEKLYNGEDLLFDIDWQGAQQLRSRMREDVVSVFILPPNKEELENRLKKRGQDTDEVMTERMASASEEITHWAEYDYVLVNKNLEDSVRNVHNILKAERLKRIRQIKLAEFVRSIKFN